MGLQFVSRTRWWMGRKKQGNYWLVNFGERRQTTIKNSLSRVNQVTQKKMPEKCTYPTGIFSLIIHCCFRSLFKGVAYYSIFLRAQVSPLGPIVFRNNEVQCILENAAMSFALDATLLFGGGDSNYYFNYPPKTNLYGLCLPITTVNENVGNIIKTCRMLYTLDAPRPLFICRLQ